MIKSLFTISFVALGLNCWAQAPAGYYTDTSGLTGYALKTRLHNIIKTGHIDKGYAALFDGYKEMDRDYYYENDGTLLDIYSEKPSGPENYNYSVTATSDRCGNYNSEGDCYNREHTIPQSLFNQASPMRNDIHFVLPTDGYVNGQRGNLPYGKVNAPNWTSTNGSKRGPNVASGFNGAVFEPIDEFKGDIARILFYFATRYQDKIPNFSQGNILDGSSTRSLQQWQVDLLLTWHQQDPVNDKEIDRNNKAFIYQGNRNPFVDHPQWVDCIWGNVNCNTTVDTGTSIKNHILENSISLYPNPTSNQFSIEAAQSAGDIETVSILSLDGREMYFKDENRMNAPVIKLDIQHFQTGMYFVKIKTLKGIIVKKIIKE